MPTINPNDTGLNAASILQARNASTRSKITSLELTSASGGKADFLSDKTPDVKGMLGTHRNIVDNSIHKNNDTKIESRVQGQVGFIQLCQSIGLELGTRLSEIRTDKGMTDDTFLNWCTEQLKIIAGTANSPMFDGTYPCASGTVTLPPINPTVVITPLPVGSGVTLDYTQGAFNPYDARLSSTKTCEDRFNVSSAGTENLIRALRVCLTGNVANTGDPVWSFSNDLLVTGAIPHLAMDLKIAGNLGQSATNTKETLENENTLLEQQFKTYGSLDEKEIIQKKFEEASKSSQQMSSLFTRFRQTQDFFDKMDQLS